MTNVALEIVDRLLAAELGEMEEYRMHLFEDDEEAHDDKAVAQLHEEFLNDFEEVASALTIKFGDAIRYGSDEDDDIPLNGVLRFGIWSATGRNVFAAVSHEDREVPILLMLGTIA